MSEEVLGIMLRENIMAGLPSRMKAYKDYMGLGVPPCGEYAPKPTSIDPPPWMPAQHNPGVFQRLSLHREIEHFMAYMRPTNEEVIIRKDLISRFTRLVGRVDSKAKVRCVGPEATGLCFPTSDIDMVITFGSSSIGPSVLHSSSSTKARFSELEFKIRSSGFASKIDSFLTGPVPLLRIRDAVTGVKIELTAATDDHGVRAAEAVQAWTRSENRSVIESLVMVLKLFLAIRRLDTTYSGGVNMYMLVWMVVAWVELELPKLSLGKGASYSRRDEVNPRMVSSHGLSSKPWHSTTTPSSYPDPINLGVALTSFLKFYGEEFDATTATIRFSENSVTYAVKNRLYSHSTLQEYLISVTDPVDADVDLGLKAYAIKHVQASFLEAYQALESLEHGYGSRSQMVKARMQGTLGCLLGGDYTHFIFRRKRILEKWRRSKY
ncbi:poly(A) polymerase Cid14 [Coprinopsis marcescibilis]|uniref:polynucleotide adenylyltransferase n=1 Tax=Coprinopsis marcescibilis TaxID=230819 RepID=A0A5C3L0F0_COPMA|nr:poly(A) polymerase Cid14 [Coprinopsis marcescibilis]